MGQYQQWLHYQHIDRRLRATLAALEQELVGLESQSSDYPPSAALLDNPIICALFAFLTASANDYVPRNHGDAHNTIPASEIYEQASNGSAESILPPLSFDHPEIELLPEDIFDFYEEHSQTDPQLELPWWLRNITITNGDDETGKPIDQESIRTNRLVQRWVERWGRQSQSGFTSESESEGIRDAE